LERDALVLAHHALTARGREKERRERGREREREREPHHVSELCTRSQRDIPLQTHKRDIGPYGTRPAAEERVRVRVRVNRE